MIWAAVLHDGKLNFLFFENHLNGQQYNKAFEKSLLSNFLIKNLTKILLWFKKMLLFAIPGGILRNDEMIKLEWTESLDLNPIEHVGKYLNRKIPSRKTEAKSTNDLKKSLTERVGKTGSSSYP